jgi:hypothetical protein
MLKRICTSLGLLIVGGLALSPTATAQSRKISPDEVTVSGTVTCSKYVYAQPNSRSFSHPKAIRQCVGQGYQYVLASSETVYPLRGNQDELANVAGRKVAVTGKAYGDRIIGPVLGSSDTIEVASVDAGM